jgi:hypothetical protein
VLFHWLKGLKNSIKPNIDLIKYEIKKSQKMYKFTQKIKLSRLDSLQTPSMTDFSQADQDLSEMHLNYQPSFMMSIDGRKQSQMSDQMQDLQFF